MIYSRAAYISQFPVPNRDFKLTLSAANRRSFGFATFCDSSRSFATLTTSTCNHNQPQIKKATQTKLNQNAAATLLQSHNKKLLKNLLNIQDSKLWVENRHFHQPFFNILPIFLSAPQNNY
jgi:hypothetical protein